ncbi:gliding motility-associated C-terminal domain-containing protein [Lishizhenia sp.]|uniref:T9SS type B sorting domain-containing protein n=1 Tax=Lishizhenia sp. TaxID=2497594 RepID=UPI00299CD5D8|nr:gliding motility-associated C-terminal domain-containing protein [Lishizhenia sp.]MDX1446260.1 gliding motility-associated C-terminal domain-containing protein [Lishizhenia sp.]
MIKKSFFLFLLSCAGMSFAQTPTPGNVGTANLTAWFKPDALANGDVTTWSTSFPTGAAQVTVTDAQAPYPQATNTPVGNVSNYNKTLHFTNTNAITAATVQALENNTAGLSLIENGSSGDEGSFFSAHYIPTNTQNDHMVLYNSGTDGIQLRNLGNTGRLAIGYTLGTSVNACRDWTEDFEPEIISYKGNRSTFNSMDAYQSSWEYTGGVASQSGGGAGLYFGVRANGGGAYTNNSGLNGFLHEVIFFNRDLTLLEMNKVHTYLAIKYGVTLLNTGGGTQGDYIATDGTVIWDASDNPAYHNDVIGISRDDDEALLQKQSHAFDDSYRIYLANLAASNDANGGAFAVNLSHVTMGQNQGSYCASPASTLEAPAGIGARFENEFKVTKTNFAQVFNWDVKMDSCYDMSGIDMTKLRLLVDTDGDFSNATIYQDGQDGLAFSYANGYFTIEGIGDLVVPNNSTRYLTLAYNEPEVVLTPDTNTICEGDTVTFTISITGTNVPVDFEYTDGTDTTLIQGAVDGDIFEVYPIVTTTYEPIGYVNILKCCTAPGQTTNSTIVVNQRPIVQATASDSVLCDGDTTILSGVGASIYTWDNGVVDGAELYPTATNTYTVIGEDQNGCLDTSSVIVVVNPNPVVAANASATVLCLGDSTLLFGSGAVNYFWDNNVVDSTYNTPQVTTLYHVLGVNQFGCVDTASIEITVNNLPNVVANTTADAVCEGDPVTLFGAGATIYNWDLGVTDNQSFVPQVSNMYHLTGTDDDGCVNYDSVFVEVYPARTVSVGPDTVICPQDPIMITTDSVFTSYQWSNGSTSQTITSTYQGTYSVEVTDEYGCTYTDAMVVTFSTECYPAIYVPNTFTPDGNEHNNTLIVRGDYIENFEMWIYDRWGNLLYNSRDINATWDGANSLGQPMKSGTYVYKIMYSIEDEEDKNYTLTGHINLLR